MRRDKGTGLDIKITPRTLFLQCRYEIDRSLVSPPISNQIFGVEWFLASLSLLILIPFCFCLVPMQSCTFCFSYEEWRSGIFVGARVRKIYEKGFSSKPNSHRHTVE